MHIIMNGSSSLGIRSGSLCIVKTWNGIVACLLPPTQ